MTKKIALVTGAGGGIGVATARRFAEEGYAVALADYSDDAVTRAQTAVAAAVPSAELFGVVADVSSEPSVIRAAEAVRERFGELHAVALVAGVLQEATAVVDQTVEVWDRVFDVNARGVFLSAKHFASLLPDHSGASITSIASWSGRLGSAYFSAYCASKAAVIVFSQSLAYELAPRGIRVNTVAPGNIDTGMHRAAIGAEAQARGISAEEMKEIEWQKIPLGYAGPPETVADAVLFLASERAAYITGESLDVGGGVHMR